MTQANANLESLEAGPDGLQLSKLEAAVRVARTDVGQSGLAVERLIAGAGSLTRQKLAAALEKAETDLSAAVVALGDLSSQPAPELLASLKEAGFSREILDAVKDGADPAELESRHSRLALAESALALARQDLESLEAGPDPVEMALRQNQMTAAEATLAESRAALEGLLEGAGVAGSCPGEGAAGRCGAEIGRCPAVGGGRRAALSH